MKVKLTIFVLSVLVAWSSVFVAGHHINYCKEHQLKVATEFICKVIEADDDLVYKKSPTVAPAILLNFALAEIHAWSEGLKIIPFYAHKTVKYYLLFRVLRN